MYDGKAIEKMQPEKYWTFLVYSKQQEQRLFTTPLLPGDQVVLSKLLGRRRWMEIIAEKHKTFCFTFWLIRKIG